LIDNSQSYFHGHPALSCASYSSLRGRGRKQRAVSPRNSRVLDSGRHRIPSVRGICMNEVLYVYAQIDLERRREGCPKRQTVCGGSRHIRLAPRRTLSGSPVAAIRYGPSTAGPANVAWCCSRSSRRRLSPAPRA
jgi:hypothetical protein